MRDGPNDFLRIRETIGTMAANVRKLTPGFRPMLGEVPEVTFELRFNMSDGARCYRTSLCNVIAIAGCVLGSPLLAQSSFGQCPPETPPRTWRVVPILQAPVELSFYRSGIILEDWPQGRYGTLAISDSGFIAGTYLLSNGSGGYIPRPFVWVTDPSFNGSLSVGFHDLLTLSGASSTEPGYANDVSDDGIVVGGRGGEYYDPALYAYAWDLASYPSGGFNQPLDTVSNATVSWSVATAIQTATPSVTPSIVGLGGICTDGIEVRPGVFELGSAAVFDLFPNQPPPAMGSGQVAAHQIYFTDTQDYANSGTEGATLTYEGGSPTPVDECLTGLQDLNCGDDDFQVGARDVIGAGTTFLRWGPSAMEADPRQTTVARGIAPTGYVCGTYHEPIDANNCYIYPAYWDAPSGAVAYPPAIPPLPTLPTGFSPPAPQFEEATAEGIKNFDCLRHRMVGWNLDVTLSSAMVWDQCIDDDSWCVHSIDSLSLTSSQVAGLGFNIVIQAFETDTAGHIVVIMDSTTCPNSVTRCVGVVTSVNDLDGDFRVGSGDLSVLLGAWGIDPCAADAGDLNESGTVDSTDLAILIGAWTSTPIPIAWPCSNLGECEDPLPGPSFLDVRVEHLQTAFGMVGFTTVEDFLTWAPSADPELIENFVQLVRSIASS